VGLTTYGGQYSLDGTMTLMASHEPALVAMNGVSAMTATSDKAIRTAFVDAVWNLPTPTGFTRYFPGLMDLLALMTLGGQLRIW
jgi:oligosaccharide reducing-end xylanase